MRILPIAVLAFVTLTLGACGGGGRAHATAKKPTTAAAGAFTQTGMASWYGPGFAGKLTANGERFDPDEMTCAHPKLPFHTRIRVTNLANGKSVIVRVNDRGPFAKQRIVDLSKEAAKRLGFVDDGVAKVRLEVVEMGQARR